MKTLAQLCPRRDSIFWHHSSEAWKLVSNLGKPTHTMVSHTGEHYFGWHKPCYKATAYYRPANSPRTRRPIRLSGKDITELSVIENFGEHHHRFKKLSSRRLRKALKRELEREMDEVEDCRAEDIAFATIEEHKFMLEFREHFDNWIRREINN